MSPVGEGMLHVELELVVTERGEQIDQAEKRLHGRHLVAADVQHHATHREIGSVLDGEGGQYKRRGSSHKRRGSSPVPPDGGEQPTQRLRRVERALAVACGHFDSVRCHAKRVRAPISQTGVRSSHRKTNHRIVRTCHLHLVSYAVGHHRPRRHPFIHGSPGQNEHPVTRFVPPGNRINRWQFFTHPLLRHINVGSGIRILRGCIFSEVGYPPKTAISE